MSLIPGHKQKEKSSNEQSMVTCVFLEPHTGTFQKSREVEVVKTKSCTFTTMAAEPESSQEQALHSIQGSPAKTTLLPSRRGKAGELTM